MNSIWLPHPSTDDIRAFQRILMENQGIELVGDEARDAATRLLHLYILKELLSQSLTSRND
jgi:hypothetical protein